METENTTVLTVKTTVNKPVQKVWECWTDPKHIVNWYYASDDWHAPYAENDLKEQGKFKTTMAAKDGSMSFDFEGTYTLVKEHDTISYVLEDNRVVKITFTGRGEETDIVESFDAENTHSPEMQRSGWQAILDNFKRYVESN